MLLDLSIPYEANKARMYLDKLIDAGEKCDLKKITKPRTKKQNGYLHVCLGFFCNESGYTVDEAKELFSLQLPDIMRYTKNNMSFRKSTADLDTREMTVVIEKIREICNDQLGIYIPTPEEYYQNKFQIDKELQHIT